MSTTGKKGDKHSNLRDAYCAYYRIPDDRFESHLVWRSFPFHVLPFAMIFWVIERSLFAKDLEGARNAGKSASADDLEGSIQEFENLQGVERGFRRGMLGICARGSLMGKRLEPFLAMVKEKESVPIGLPISAVPVELRDGGAIPLRRIRKIRDDIAQGRPMESVLGEAGMTAAELREYLSTYSPGREDLTWFAEYLDQRDELVKLRNENKRLVLVASELSSRLIEFETRATRIASSSNDEKLPS